MFSRTKTFIQVWNYLRVSKWWQNFHFWVNYPFKVWLLSRNLWRANRFPFNNVKGSMLFHVKIWRCWISYWQQQNGQQSFNLRADTQGNRNSPHKALNQKDQHKVWIVRLIGLTALGIVHDSLEHFSLCSSRTLVMRKSSVMYGSLFRVQECPRNHQLTGKIM